jgi:hypothetical protein
VADDDPELLPTLTEPDELESLELELELFELLSSDVEVVVEVVEEALELLVASACATAATATVPPRLRATSAPVAALSRRRPCSLRFCAFMGSPSGTGLCARPVRPVPLLWGFSEVLRARFSRLVGQQAHRERTARAWRSPRSHPDS